MKVERLGVAVIAAALGVFLLITASQAQAGAVEDEIRALRQRLEVLEKHAQQVKEDKEKEIEEPVITWLKSVKLSGNLSTSVNYNFNEPDTRTNDLRIFDTEANTFKLDLFELVLEKEAPEAGGVGFRVDLDYGEVAESIGAAGLGTTDDEFDLQQAYISLSSPFGIEGLDFKIGKFVTLLGYEVIESWDNSNTSRSYLFGYAIPFTHTGIVGNYAFDDKWFASLGLVNGWDNVDDNNDAKTLLARIGFNPLEKLSLCVTGIYGAEQANDNGSQRGVVDLVASLEVSDKLSLGLNYDYGKEEAPLVSDYTWQGVAGYLTYQLTDRWGLAGRLEYFDDEDGSRTTTSQELWELTLTNEYKLFDNLLMRAEYRHDDSNKNSFTDHAKAVDTQDTISLELIYSF